MIKIIPAHPRQSGSLTSHIGSSPYHPGSSSYHLGSSPYHLAIPGSFALVCPVAHHLERASAANGRAPHACLASAPCCAVQSSVAGPGLGFGAPDTSGHFRWGLEALRGSTGPPDTSGYPRWRLKALRGRTGPPDTSTPLDAPDGVWMPSVPGAKSLQTLRVPHMGSGGPQGSHGPPDTSRNPR